MSKVAISGYEQDGICEHCGRTLKHCIRISDGRIVGAACLDKQITKPRVRDGKPFRFGAKHIVHMAKVVQFAPANRWSAYGVNQTSIEFECA